MFSLVTNHKDLKSIPTTSQYKPTATIVNDVDSKLGVVVEYFDIPAQNKNLSVVNVTGAGDTMVGYLAAKLANSVDGNWLNCEIKSCEQVWMKWECIYKAQLASGLTLMSEKSVSEEISKL